MFQKNLFPFLIHSELGTKLLRDHNNLARQTINDLDFITMVYIFCYSNT